MFYKLILYICIYVQSCRPTVYLYTPPIVQLDLRTLVFPARACAERKLASLQWLHIAYQVRIDAVVS
jgi:hypothetical protein